MDQTISAAHRDHARRRDRLGKRRPGTDRRQPSARSCICTMVPPRSFTSSRGSAGWKWEMQTNISSRVISSWCRPGCPTTCGTPEMRICWFFGSWRRTGWRTSGVRTKLLPKICNAAPAARISSLGQRCPAMRISTAACWICKPPSALTQETLPGQEAVIYVSNGSAEVQVGKLSGRLQAHEFVHVPVGTAYSMTAAGGNASVLLFEMPWKE